MRFWRNQSASSGDRRPKRVLVDLLVDHPVYYLGNLVLAKYFELTRGLKPWALVSSASDRKIILLARSFGIDQFTFVRDEVVKEARAEAAGVLAQFEGHSGHELRRRVLGLNINGLSVGDLLYDTFLRETRRVTMEQVDDDLRAYTILLFNYYALYGRLLSDEDVDVVVMGHLVYLRFGVLARMAAAGGAEVAARYGGKGMRVQLRNNVTGVTDVMTRIKPSMVDKILFTEGDKAASIGRQTLVRRMSGIGNEFKYLNEEGYSPDRQKLSSRGLTEVLGLKAGRSRGLLMLHAFPDANHFSPGLLFDDFYDWYRQTVAAIVEMPNTDWLIKLHPNLSHYTDDTSPVAYAAEMARRYEHLHLVPDGLY